MTRPIEKISNDLFQKLRARFSPVTLGSEDAESTTDPNAARFFNFLYKEDEVPLGPITISIVDNRSLKVFYGTDIVQQVTDKTQWFGLLKELRNFAKRNMLQFDARDLAKNQLNKQDFEFIKTMDGNMDHKDIEVTESVMYGSARKSYQALESVKLVVNHRKSIDETIPGARSRYIESIFIERADGERYKFPYNYLTGARAMANHVAEGGTPYDALGTHMLGMIKEMRDLSKFARKTKKFAMEDEAANDIRTKVVERFQNLKHSLSALSSSHGYKMFAEAFKPEESSEESDLTTLKERLTMRVFDQQMEDLLPAVNRALQFADMNQINETSVSIEKLIKNPLVLKIDSAADQMFRTTKFTDGMGLLSFIMSDIASRAIGDNADELANFASDAAERVHDRDYPANDKQLALRLAKKYMEDAKRIAHDVEYASEVRKDPSEIYGAKKTLKPKVKKVTLSPKLKESINFEEWATATIPFDLLEATTQGTQGTQGTTASGNPNSAVNAAQDRAKQLQAAKRMSTFAKKSAGITLSPQIINKGFSDMQQGKPLPRQVAMALGQVGGAALSAAATDNRSASQLSQTMSSIQRQQQKKVAEDNQLPGDILSQAFRQGKTKPQVDKMFAPGGKPVIRQPGVGANIDKIFKDTMAKQKLQPPKTSAPMSTADVAKASMAMKNPTQRPYDAGKSSNTALNAPTVTSTSAAKGIPIPTAKPTDRSVVQKGGNVWNTFKSTFGRAPSQAELAQIAKSSGIKDINKVMPGQKLDFSKIKI